VLDFSGEAVDTDGMSISGSYYWLYGLVFTNAGHNSIKITSGNYNTVERCVSLGARDTGFNISGGNGATVYPATNLFLNCDSIRSYDAPIGGDADGFSAKWSLGLGNGSAAAALERTPTTAGICGWERPVCSSPTAGLFATAAMFGIRVLLKATQRIQAGWQRCSCRESPGGLPGFP